MKYHNITHDDMINGEGIRVVLWVSGCEHRCKGCHNPITWDPNSGINFDEAAKDELFEELHKDYISGITLTGGDPLHYNNRESIFCLVKDIKNELPLKTIWVYTGYIWEEVYLDKYLKKIVEYVDVLVDGKFDYNLLDVNYPWAGSKNQRVINVRKSLDKGDVILYEHH